ncbi:MAG: AAA family ATPase, partial [Bacillota bacterium]|nr:AAA family ATPase [Bacillota bacterium]
NTEEISFHKNVTFLMGENGCGKSTLLEALATAYGFNPQGGTANYRFSAYNDVSCLNTAVKLVKGYKRPQSSYFFRAETFFDLAVKAKDYNSIYGDRDLHCQSHGESFLAFFTSFQGEGLYIMDEPEAALSPERQLTLLLHIHKRAEEGSQFIIATHSPILSALPGGEIYTFTDQNITPQKYEDTESYKVTKMLIEGGRDFLTRIIKEFKS